MPICWNIIFLHFIIWPLELVDSLEMYLCLLIQTDAGQSSSPASTFIYHIPAIWGQNTHGCLPTVLGATLVLLTRGHPKWRCILRKSFFRVFLLRFFQWPYNGRNLVLFSPVGYDEGTKLLFLFFPLHSYFGGKKLTLGSTQLNQLVLFFSFLFRWCEYTTHCENRSMIVSIQFHASYSWRTAQKCA